jgi:hypothetical protein
MSTNWPESSRQAGLISQSDEFVLKNFRSCAKLTCSVNTSSALTQQTAAPSKTGSVLNITVF